MAMAHIARAGATTHKHAARPGAIPASCRVRRPTTQVSATASSDDQQLEPCSSGRSAHAPTSRRAAIFGPGLVGGAWLLQRASPAVAKPALLDLPSCTTFHKAGELQYCDVDVGSGDSPLEGDLIVVDYTARATATGQVYDGSRGFAFTVGNQEVIPGWERAILGTAELPAIKAGGTRTVLIPPQLAYGERGDGCLFGLSDNCRVPPNSAVEITFKYKGLGY